MYFESIKTSLLLLGITSTVCSRVMFLFFNDPEGPNLLVVMGTAAMVYFLSLAAYLFNFASAKRFFLAISIQIVIVAGLYLCLN